LAEEIRARYESELDLLCGDSRLWIDGIIDPVETRGAISRGIEMATHYPDLPKFNPGIIQT
jgi:3-methylcrotonyl-CoA carboxylase beta subunit